jgi:hypothetical protein
MSGGVYQVGVDVQPGQLENDSGDFDAIIANGYTDGSGSVTVNAGEFVELHGDWTWTKVD